jgi:serine/threonine protein kinase
MSKIVGNYELTLKLGSGSYAQVYKCIHSKSGEPYAIKAISKGDTVSLLAQYPSLPQMCLIRYHIDVSQTDFCFTVMFQQRRLEIQNSWKI